MRFSVDEWGSHPDENNDDCWTGEEFPTLEEARAAYDTLTKGELDKHTAFVILSGEGVVIAIFKNPKFKPSQKDGVDELWRQESQNQAAMEHGVQGWNDYEGC